MSEGTPSITRAHTRRTVLRAAAWSVPVVAATTAVPAYAASGDVLFGAVAGGYEGTWINASNTRIAHQFIGDFQIWVQGKDPVPAGSTLTLSWDQRISADLAPRIGGVALVRSGPLTTSGNAVTGVYTIPVAIPADGTRVTVNVAFNPGPDPIRNWYPTAEDLAPFIFAAAPPAGSATQPSSTTMSADYAPTYDLAVSVPTWQSATVLAGGASKQVWLPSTFRIDSLGPGPSPATIWPRFIITLPAITGASNVIQGFTATIDGTATSSYTFTKYDEYTYGVDLQVPLAVGSVFAATWTNALPPAPTAASGVQNGSVSYSTTPRSGDTTASNNTATHA